MARAGGADAVERQELLETTGLKRSSPWPRRRAAKRRGVARDHQVVLWGILKRDFLRKQPYEAKRGTKRKKRTFLTSFDTVCAEFAPSLRRFKFAPIH